jgi:PKD repeat protein
VTGYYGVLTEAAVRKFQCKNQIVCDGTPESTGYGVVGPRTAAILALQCPAGGSAASLPGTSAPGGGSGFASGGVFVTPTGGRAPLNVLIETYTNITRSCTGTSYELLYGDGAPPVRIDVPVGNCNELKQNFTHTYSAPGTYIVVLRSGIHQSTATVVVNAPAPVQQDELSASPTSGAAPLNVSFTGKANASGSCTPAIYTLKFGDNTNDATIPVSNCSISTFAVTHGYNGGGTFTARLMRDSSEVDSVQITASGNPTGSTQGGGSFTAVAGHGGDAFSVLATFELASSCTAYDIDWGDGSPHNSQSTGSCATGTVIKEISHTYSGNGSYTITLKRGTGSGQTTDTAGVAISY